VIGISGQIIKRSASQLGRRDRQLTRQAQDELAVPVIGVIDQIIKRSPSQLGRRGRRLARR
jgi:hypothetical protein